LVLNTFFIFLKQNKTQQAVLGLLVFQEGGVKIQTSLNFHTNKLYHEINDNFFIEM